jgi:predicted unusual protein kinase regulating ubiquinone biosynthesis (AarF/ABC1/UbiB family)
MLDFGSVCVLDPAVRRGYVRLARALAANDDEEIGAAGITLGFVRHDPTTFVRLMRLAAEPLMRDARFDPRDYDVVARATEALQIKLGSEPLQAPGHHVFISRAMIGMDGYLRAFGTVRNWHRLFREILDALPAAPGSVDEGVAGFQQAGGSEEPTG